ncbi:MAG: SLBB domain-containing protein [Candidatus Melainabacteria bacterium]|nr:SLBB domain-containing protein [Candidatus Melainabacteria bacterium]
MNNESKKIRLQAFSLFLMLALLFNQIAFAQEIETPLKKSNPSQLKLQAVLTPPYVLGPGDQLSVIDRTLKDVIGQVEQYLVTVSADGYISIPLPDGTQENILAAGYTLDEISNEIRSSFGRTLKNPLLFVQISRYRPVNVYIGGEIVKPGVYKIESSSTTEKGGSTTSSLNTFGLSLTQAIQLAGGLKPRADIRAIIVTRGFNSEKKIIDLRALLLGEDTSQDINLQPGDSIFVNSAKNYEDQAQSHVSLLGKLAYQEVPISVTGEVKSAMNIVLPNDATLLDAIGSAGGLNYAGSLKKIRLSRYDKDGIYRTHNINLHDLIFKGVSFDQIALRPNDAIELISSKGKETRHWFREISTNVVATLVGSATGSLGGFIVQDSLFNRVVRANKSSLPGSQQAGSNSPFIIFGNNKLERNINNND